MLRDHRVRQNGSQQFPLPEKGTFAYQLVQMADYYTDSRDKIPLATLYFIYFLNSNNQTFEREDMLQNNWIYPISKVFKQIYADRKTQNKQENKKIAEQLFNKIAKQTQNLQKNICDDEIIFNTVKNNNPTPINKLVTREPTAQWQDIGHIINTKIIFDLDQKYWINGLKLFCTIMSINSQVSSKYSDKSFIKVSNIGATEGLKYKADTRLQFMKNVTQMMKKKEKMKQQEDNKVVQELKSIEEKKTVEFGDFSKFAYYKQIKQSFKKNEVQMIVKQAIQSHRQAVQQITKLDSQTQEMLRTSWTEFIFEIGIIKTHKQFAQFSSNPTNYFIKNCLNKRKLKVSQVSQQFAKIMIRYFNFVNIQGRVLHKKNLYLERSLKNLEESYIPMNDKGNILLKTSDKSINYLINEKIIKKNTGYYLSQAQISYMENSIIEFLKIKNLDKSRQQIKSMLVQELNKMLKTS